MKKYQILVEGSNFFLKLSKKDIKKYGFYATRFVEAETPERAFEIVKDILRNQIKREDIYNEEDNPPILYPNEIDEVECFDDIIIPGEGFTFFSEEGNILTRIVKVFRNILINRAVKNRSKICH